MFAPRSRATYTPTGGTPCRVLILDRVNGVSAYHVRTSTGRRITVPETQLTTNNKTR